MAGSHITKLALASAMQRLMTEQPFERISVSDICTACGMSRKSFYYHFRDKYDLVGWIFEAEFVEPNRERSFSSSWEFFDALCSYFSALFPGKRENSFFTDFFTDAFLVSIIRWLRSPEPMPAQEYVARLKEVVTGIARKVAQEEI